MFIWVSRNEKNYTNYPLPCKAVEISGGGEEDLEAKT
jgi:hypothetical protein